MSSRKPAQAPDVSVPVRLEGWKVAIAIGGALVIAPVFALVVFVLLATLLPVLLLLPTVLVGAWLSRQKRPSSSPPVRPSLASFPSSSGSKALASGAVFLALCSMCLLGCSSAPSSAAGTDTRSVGGSARASATFTAMYTPILQPTCSGCHNPSGVGSFQDFSSQVSAYAALVGVKASGPSCGSSDETRVVAGSASRSLLFQKVSEATPPCGSQMPLGGPPLSTAQMTFIEDWINAGALDD